MTLQPLMTTVRPPFHVCTSCIRTIKAAYIAPTVTYRELPFASYSKTEAPKHYSTTTCRRARRPRPLAVWELDNFLRSRAVSRTYATDPFCLSPTQPGVAPLPHRRLVSVAGPDAAKFLQGLLTNNVEPARLTPFYAAFLDARGRVLWDVFVWVWPELVAEMGHWGCYIEADANEVEILKKHLKKHKLRSKVDIKDVATEGPEGLRVWAAWDGAHERVQQGPDIIGFKDPRTNDLYRYLAKADRETVTLSTLQVEPYFYHMHRYVQGVAEGAAEIPRENALPMEYNIDLSGGIDFKKGCYVGQELTIRTKHTGVVRKRVLPVQLHHAPPTGALEKSPQIPCNGADIKSLDEAGRLKKGRPTGKLISSLGNVGLALCRLENMTPVRVSAEGGTFKNGAEFGVEVGDSIIKVVPVLHPWFLQRKEALWDAKKTLERP